MKFLAYVLWTFSAPFFLGGLVWVIMPVFMPLWAVALGMVAHACVWTTVIDHLNAAGWDN